MHGLETIQKMNQLADKIRCAWDKQNNPIAARHQSPAKVPRAPRARFDDECQIIVPRGWFRLAAGCQLQLGDCYLEYGNRKWQTTSLVFEKVSKGTAYIRKIK